MVNYLDLDRFLSLDLDRECLLDFFLRDLDRSRDFLRSRDFSRRRRDLLRDRARFGDLACSAGLDSGREALNVMNVMNVM